MDCEYDVQLGFSKKNTLDFNPYAYLLINLFHNVTKSPRKIQLKVREDGMLLSILMS